MGVPCLYCNGGAATGACAHGPDEGLPHPDHQHTPGSLGDCTGCGERLGRVNKESKEEPRGL